MSLASILKEMCVDALSISYGKEIAQQSADLIEITEATSEEFGHFQCNGALKLAKNLKQPPIKIAEKIIENMKKAPTYSNVIESVEAKAPGFINFKIKTDYLSHALNTFIHDNHLGIEFTQKPQKVVIDFSSPNIAKEMHVGHLRSTIIGDCLRRLFSFLGEDVLSLNHVGDFGTQFGMLIAYIKDKQNEFKNNEAFLGQLTQIYKAAKKRFDEDPEFKKRAQLEVIALQQGEKENKKLWEMICLTSEHHFDEIYDKLGIKKLIKRGESFYQEKLPEVVKELEQKNLITISDGAKCVYLEGFTNRDGEPLPLIIQKSDGGYNYAATDLAALKHRIFDENAKQILYVVDAGQSLHFQMVFAAARKANYYDPEKVRVEHVPFGLVLRSDGKKFKTREGDTERLIDLLNTGIEKARQILIEREPNTEEKELEEKAKILGINSIKYADLACNRTSDYVFSYEKMLRFEGNTAAFIMYAYVRILSIQRKTKVNINELIQSKTNIEIQDKTEMALALLIVQFADVLKQMSQDLLPSRLTEYLYRVAEKFHSFFHQCRVEGTPEQNSRLLLCEITARVLKQGMEILGLQPLERM